MTEIKHNIPDKISEEKSTHFENNNVEEFVTTEPLLIEMVDSKLPKSFDNMRGLFEKRECTHSNNNNNKNLTNAADATPSINYDDKDELNDEERMLLYDKALHFQRLGSLNHALLCFLGCLQGLQPTSHCKFTMLPQCLTHISEIYAASEDYQRAVEFMQAAKLYYEIAIIETGIQVDEYKKEADSPYRALDLDPCLDEAKRANEYEKLSYSCLEHKKFQLALDYCGKATKLRQQVYGDDHPITAKTLDLFTLIYAEMGKCQYGEALQKYGELTAVIEKEKQEEKVEEEWKEIENEEEWKEIENEEEKPQDNRSGGTGLEQEHLQEPEEEGLLTTACTLPLDEAPSLNEASSLNEPSNLNECEESVKGNDDIFEDASNNPHDDNVTDVPTDVRTNADLTSNNEKSDNTNEQSVQLISRNQLIVIFITSAILSVFLTAVWCYFSESRSCPSRRYLYETVEYWFYVYIVSPLSDGKRDDYI